MRLLLPFVQLLRGHPAVPEAVLDSLARHDPDDRMPADRVHALLAAAIEATADRDLGLKAGCKLEMGQLGALEYVARSAQTPIESLAIVGRYLHLLNDGLELTIETIGDDVHVHLRDALVLPPAAEDFALTVLHTTVTGRFEAQRTPFEIHFHHEAPSDLREYEATFPGGTLRFSAVSSRVVFARSLFERELPTRDPHLHALIRRQADQMLAELPKVETFTTRVRACLLDSLHTGEPSAPRIAKSLGVSLRTFTRKLAQEGVTYKILLEQVRQSLALRYAASTDLMLSEMALLLGFSHATAFNRAFKRWTGTTPIEYRRAHRRE